MIDLSGQFFSLWKVIDRAGNDKHRSLVWNCICACGKETKVAGGSLREGRSNGCQSCSKLVDLEGQQIADWKVIEIADIDKHGETLWK